MTTAKEALEQLVSGNRRFVAGQRPADPLTSEQRAELAQGQAPFAIILGCSDSRVPVELIFDQGPGALFVIRVAGNVVTLPQLGSVEFAVHELGSRLVVVLGHSECGAIKTTLDAIRRPPEHLSPGLGSLVEAIRPGVQPLLDATNGEDSGTLVSRAVRANVFAAVAQLSRESELLTPLVTAGELWIVGAEYDLQTGEVEFFRDVE